MLQRCAPRIKRRVLRDVRDHRRAHRTHAKSRAQFAPPTWCDDNARAPP
jgi:hypothetical protein